MLKNKKKMAVIVESKIKPGYKETEAGVIPKDWKVGELGSFLKKIVGGGTPSRAEEDYWNGDIPWVTVKDFASFSPIKTQEYITKEGLRNSSSNLIPPKALITSTRMGLGKVSIYDIEVAINQDLKALFPNENLDLKYLYYWFNKNERFIEYLGVGSTVKGITLTDLKSLQFFEIPLPEQKAIANCLTTWDKGIEELSALIASKKEQKNGLMQQLLTGKKRLDGFTEEWREVRLAQVAKIVMGVSPSSSNYNDEKEGMLLIQGNADIKNRVSSPRQYTSEITKECNIGDILMSVRAPVGEISKSIHNACIGRGVCAIQSNKNAESNFLYYYLVYTEPLWNRLKQGSTFESVNTTDIKDFKLTIPAITEQTAISNVLTKADKEIDLLEKKLETFKTQKKGLMQVLLTGEKRLVFNI